jgi:lysozyme
MTSCSPKILILDIETKLIPLLAFGIRDQYIDLKQIVDIPGSARGVHMVGLKWAGERKTTVLTEWDHGYESMIRQTRDKMDEADGVVGFNHASFDMKKLDGQFALLAKSKWLKGQAPHNRSAIPSETPQPAGGSMNINEAGIELIKQFEGLELRAYRCAAGVWSIGYGHTQGVTPGMVITEAEADLYLRMDIAEFEAGVEEALEGAPTTDGQFSAFVSLAFNIGLSAFRKSTTLARHKAGDHAGAAEALTWFKKAGGRVLQGLIRRRAAEKALYES